MNDLHNFVEVLTNCMNAAVEAALRFSRVNKNNVSKSLLLLAISFSHHSRETSALEYVLSLANINGERFFTVTARLEYVKEHIS